MIFCCFLNCFWQIIYSMKLCHLLRWCLSVPSLPFSIFLAVLVLGLSKPLPTLTSYNPQPTFINSVTSVSFFTFSTTQHLLNQFPVLIAVLKYLVWFLFTHQDPDWHITHIVCFQIIWNKVVHGDPLLIISAVCVLSSFHS